MVNPLDQAYIDSKPILLGQVWRLTARHPFPRWELLLCHSNIQKLDLENHQIALLSRMLLQLPQYLSQIPKNKIRLGTRIRENIKRQQERLEEHTEGFLVIDLKTNWKYLIYNWLLKF